jgi:methylated-DNA-[protein]-cysteine S-methyltransferase
MLIPTPASSFPDPDGFLVHLELAASSSGITRVGLRREGEAGPGSVRSESGRIGRLLAQAREEIRQYLVGERTAFEVAVDLCSVSGFDRAALEVAAAIPYGEVRTYRWIAAQLGRPNACRAVGGAMARNPVLILVPCHRVIRSDGGLGGYVCGLPRKAELLALEARRELTAGGVDQAAFSSLMPKLRISEFCIPDVARAGGELEDRLHVRLLRQAAEKG